jgi:HEAT repeat protein
LTEQLSCQATGTFEVPPAIIRFQAAEALGKIGPRATQALPALREALSDPAPAVQQAAARAIERIER